MKKIILKATDLDGFITDKDKENIDSLLKQYDAAITCCGQIENATKESDKKQFENELIDSYKVMGDLMRDISSEEDRINVYSFETPLSHHGEVSRLIAKLRDVKTPHDEFVYYIQRAYEILFNSSFCGKENLERNYLMFKTPVNYPVQNYAIHKLPNVDESIRNSVMCVMLRGALLPSMIMSKEMQEYSSEAFVTPFALFSIKRDDSRKENDMEYILDLEKSYFDLDKLHGKDLVFADPMNATGGSFVTIVKYILDQGIKPRSIKFVTVISALKGALRVVRALDNVTLYTLWMDPVLNEKAYILPGLGDAGDRLNGEDSVEAPRNIIQLIADYGSNIANLYRSQVREIEGTVLGKS